MTDPRNYPGEFELVVLLSILRCGDAAFAVQVIRELDNRTGRKVSRGAFYKTVERLNDKGLVDWDVEATTPTRGGHPRRRFAVTPAGLEVVRTSTRALLSLTQGLEDTIGLPVQ